MEKNIENTIVQFLVDKITPLFIILFGSRVTGRVNKDSDIDIAFLSEKEMDKYELFLIGQELAATINIEVDLIDLSRASTVFQAQIIHTGKTIYCSDKKAKAEFELKALKMYAKLNEERAPILKQINESGSIYENDVILNKINIIERCIRRIHEEYENNPEHLKNFTKQDSIVLNLQRACEASIDLAMHIVAEKKIGLPQNSRDAFTLLEQENIIPVSLSRKMKAMVGFRNIAVHDYQEINIEILQKILENHLVDFSHFTKIILLY